MNLTPRNKKLPAGGILIAIFVLLLAFIVILRLVKLNPDKETKQKQLVLFEFRNQYTQQPAVHATIKCNNKVVYKASLDKNKAFQKNLHLAPGHHTIHIKTRHAEPLHKDIKVKANQRYEMTIICNDDPEKPIQFRYYKLSEDLLIE